MNNSINLVDIKLAARDIQECALVAYWTEGKGDYHVKNMLKAVEELNKAVVIFKEGNQ